MGWFFNKDGERKWDFLHFSLKTSFNNIKNDINLLRVYMNSNNNRVESRMLELERRLYRLESMAHLPKQPEPPQIREIEAKREEELKFEDDISEFTNLQKSILINLFILTKESNTKWLGMKDLSQEIYPNKDYNSIRSMISTYTDSLHDGGFIQKMRKGRDTYLSLTEKGLSFMEKEKLVVSKK